MSPSDLPSLDAQMQKELIERWRLRAQRISGEEDDGMLDPATLQQCADELAAALTAGAEPRKELDRYMPIQADLLPCPFCGEKAVLTNVRQSDHSFCVGCVNESCWRPRTVYYDNKEAVVTAWNTRAVGAEPPQQGRSSR